MIGTEEAMKVAKEFYSESKGQVNLAKTYPDGYLFTLYEGERTVGGVSCLIDSDGKTYSLPSFLGYLPSRYQTVAEMVQVIQNRHQKD